MDHLMFTFSPSKEEATDSKRGLLPTKENEKIRLCEGFPFLEEWKAHHLLQALRLRSSTSRQRQHLRRRPLAFRHERCPQHKSWASRSDKQAPSIACGISTAIALSTSVMKSPANSSKNIIFQVIETRENALRSGPQTPLASLSPLLKAIR